MMKKKPVICITSLCVVLMAGCSGQGSDAGNKEMASATAEMTAEATPTATVEATPETMVNTSAEDTALPTPEMTARNATAAADFSTDAAPAEEKKQISMDQAKKIALKKAGLSAKDGKWVKGELEREDGRKVYDLEFVSGEREYEFEVDARTGAVVDFKEESVYD